MTRLGEALLEFDDPPVDALFVYGSNPVVSAPHQGKIRRGLEREDLFTVVVEQFPTDTVDYADVVLPATMQPEHADLHCAYGHLYLAWNEPAVPPPGSACRTARSSAASPPASTSPSPPSTTPTRRRPARSSIRTTPTSPASRLSGSSARAGPG